MNYILMILLISNNKDLVYWKNYNHYIYTLVHIIFSFKQVWTQKYAVQKASVDVNISYY
jgi:hypothetical protein